VELTRPSAWGRWRGAKRSEDDEKRPLQGAEWGRPKPTGPTVGRVGWKGRPQAYLLTRGGREKPRRAAGGPKARRAGGTARGNKPAAGARKGNGEVPRQKNGAAEGRSRSERSVEKPKKRAGNNQDGERSRAGPAGTNGQRILFGQEREKNVVSPTYPRTGPGISSLSNWFLKKEKYNPGK